MKKTVVITERAKWVITFENYLKYIFDAVNRDLGRVNQVALSTWDKSFLINCFMELYDDLDSDSAFCENFALNDYSEFYAFVIEHVDSYFATTNIPYCVVRKVLKIFPMLLWLGKVVRSVSGKTVNDTINRGKRMTNREYLKSLSDDDFAVLISEKISEWQRDNWDFGMTPSGLIDGVVEDFVGWLAADFISEARRGITVDEQLPEGSDPLKDSRWELTNTVTAKDESELVQEFWRIFKGQDCWTPSCELRDCKACRTFNDAFEEWKVEEGLCQNKN